MINRDFCCIWGLLDNSYSGSFIPEHYKMHFSCIHIYKNIYKRTKIQTILICIFSFSLSLSLSVPYFRYMNHMCEGYRPEENASYASRPVYFPKRAKSRWVSESEKEKERVRENKRRWCYKQRKGTDKSQSPHRELRCISWARVRSTFMITREQGKKFIHIYTYMYIAYIKM